MTPSAQGHLAMLVFSAMVAGSFSLGSLAANEIAPTALTAARFGIASVLLVGLTLWRGQWRAVHGRAAWRYPVLGGLMALYFVLMFEGLKTAPPVSAAAVFTLTPVMAGLFGWMLMKQVTTARMALALSIGAAGALWVVFRADWAALLGFRVGRGELIYFWGCAAHAFYAPLVRHLNRGEPALVFTAGTLVGGSLLLIILGWDEIVQTDWGALPGIVWICLLYVAFFATALTFFLVQFATLRLPAAKVMAYTYLTPSWVICWEIALGHAWPPGPVFIGILLTVFALTILLRDEERAG